MAEEKESTGTSIKNIVIGLVSTVTLAVGGFITNKLTGGKEEEKPAATTPVININNTQQQTAGGTKTVVVKEKAAEAKPAQAQHPKPKDGDEFKDKTPQW